MKSKDINTEIRKPRAVDERLNGENGLLLTPTIDHLFDRGFISFEDSGTLIVSPVAHVPSLNRMGVATEGIVNVEPFTEGQKQFLEYHRESVLLQARHLKSCSPNCEDVPESVSGISLEYFFPHPSPRNQQINPKVFV